MLCLNHCTKWVVNTRLLTINKIHLLNSSFLQITDVISVVYHITILVTISILFKTVIWWGVLSLLFLCVTTYHRRTRGGVITEEMKRKSVSVILNTAHCLDEHLIIVAPHVYLTLLVPIRVSKPDVDFESPK